MFEPGEKVLCIDGSFPEAVLNYLRNLPVKGKVYTVRDIIPAQGWKGEGACAVLLVEVRNCPAPHRKEWGECGFNPERFRNLDDIKAAAALAASEPVSATGSETFTFNP